MNDDTYQDGVLTYTIQRVSATDLANETGPGKWDNGYLAFSNTELLLEKLPQYTPENGKTSVAGAEGYLMEIGLWRKRGQVYEELCAEREGTGFLKQTWRLDTRHKRPKDSAGTEHDAAPGTAAQVSNCIWREVSAKSRANSIFAGREISCIEVVWPERRLHIFITAERTKS